MDWLTEALGLGKAVFNYLDRKNATKYLDRLIELETDYHAELNKADDLINDDKLARIRSDIRILLDTAASQIGSAAIKDK